MVHLVPNAGLEDGEVGGGQPPREAMGTKRAQSHPQESEGAT
jgi:hypothetical protein